MDLLGGLDSRSSNSAQEDGEGRGAKVRVIRQAGPEGDRSFPETEMELLRTLARQGLQQDQQARLLKSLTEAFRISTEGPINQSTKKGMESLIKAQNKLREEQSLDGPAVQERLGAAH